MPQCMMLGTAAVYRDLGKHYGKIASAIVAVALVHESACICRYLRERRMVKSRPAWWVDLLVERCLVRPGVAAPPPPPPVYYAPAAGLCRGACLPSRSRTVLGWLWLASSPGPGLRLIAELICVSGLNEIKSGRPWTAVLFNRDHRT